VHETLEDHLAAWATNDLRRDVALTLTALAEAARDLGRLLARLPFTPDLVSTTADKGGEVQKRIDQEAQRIVRAALAQAPVAAMLSEEEDEPIALRAGAPLLVAVDPLDGSSNAGVNAPVGMVFSLLPARPAPSLAEAFLQRGDAQLAAGLVLFGPALELALTWGEGTHRFALDPETSTFRHAAGPLAIPEGRREYAINAANYRHWPAPVRAYVDDCVAGAEGPRHHDYNMRWHGAVIAEAFRILNLGGIYLYPADPRPHYTEGRLRLLYEAFPLAFLIEQAGGAATDGTRPILSLTPRHVHQRTPLIFGARKKVETVLAYYAGEVAVAERAPLFGKRGLFRPDWELAPCR
jgi:fructose-1,6-bisphosphatase I